MLPAKTICALQRSSPPLVFFQHHPLTAAPHTDELKEASKHDSLNVYRNHLLPSNFASIVMSAYRLVPGYWTSATQITILPCIRLLSACRYRHACVYCLRESLVCATMSSRSLTPAGASGRIRTHALHVHIIACTFYP